MYCRGMIQTLNKSNLSSTSPVDETTCLCLCCTRPAAAVLCSQKYLTAVHSLTYNHVLTILSGKKIEFDSKRMLWATVTLVEPAVVNQFRQMS